MFFFSFYYNDVINLQVTSIELWEMMQQTFLMSFSPLGCPAMPCNPISAPCILNATLPIQSAPWQPTLDQGRSIPFIPFHLSPSWTTQPFRNSVYNNGDGWEKPGEGGSWVSSHHLKTHHGNPGKGCTFNLIPRVKVPMRNLRRV